MGATLFYIIAAAALGGAAALGDLLAVLLGGVDPWDFS